MVIVNNSNRSGPYLANGITTVFARQFTVLDEDHIAVYQTIDGVTNKLTAGFTVDGIGADEGNVTFSLAPVDGSEITIIREVPLLQETDYSAQGKVSPEQVEADLDLQQMQVQDLSERLDRSYLAPVTGKEFTAGSVPQFTAEGGLTDSGASAADLFAAAGEAEASAEAAANSAEAAENAAASVAPYADLAAFAAATIPTVQVRASFYAFGKVYHVKKDAAGTVATTADGATWAPDGLNYVDMYPGMTRDGTTDDSPAVALAATYSGEIHFDGGVTTMKSRVTSSDLYLMKFHNGAIIEYTADVGAGSSAFLASPSGGNSTTRSDTQDITAISTDRRTITITNGATRAGGEWMEILSDLPLIGVTGVSGFGVRYKGEWAQIESISGNAVTLTEPLVFDYTDATEFESSKWVFNKRIEISGNGGIVGPGGYAGLTEFPDIGDFIKILNYEEVEVRNIRSTNIGDDCISTSYCLNVKAVDNWFFGPDMADPTNVPRMPIHRAKGVSTLSVRNIQFNNNYCYNLRRGVDASTTTTSVPTISTINNGNIYQNCKEVVGGHQSLNYEASGNVGRVEGFGTLRGVNSVVTNNIVDCWEQDGTALTVGLAPDYEVYTDDSPLGDLVICDNIIRGANIGCGMQFNGTSINSLICTGNTIDIGPSGTGYRFHVKQIRNVKIDDVLKGVAEGDGDNTTYVLVVVNTANVPVTEINGMEVKLRTTGHFARGVFIPGTESGEGAKGVIVDLDMEYCLRTPLSFQHVTGVLTDRDGNWAEPPLVRRLRVGNTPIADLCFAPAPGGPMPMMGDTTLIAGRPFGGIIFSPDTSDSTDYIDASKTYYAGTRVNFKNVGDGGGAIVGTSGTTGVLVGCTGSITSGTNQLLINDASLLYVGGYISVNGAGVAAAPLLAQVVAKSGTTLTLDTNASTTVTGAAVTFQAPVFNLISPQTAWYFDSIADDTAVSFTLPGSGTNRQFMLSIMTESADTHGIVVARVTNVQMEKTVGDADLEVSTGILTGTTGTDTKVTVSVHTDGKFYIENRSGSVREMTVSILSGVNYF